MATLELGREGREADTFSSFSPFSFSTRRNVTLQNVEEEEEEGEKERFSGSPPPPSFSAHRAITLASPRQKVGGRGWRDGDGRKSVFFLLHAALASGKSLSFVFLSFLLLSLSRVFPMDVSQLTNSRR